MYSPLAYNSTTSFRQLLLLKLSDFVGHFLKKTAYAINDGIAETFEKRAAFFERRVKRAGELSVPLAVRYLKNVKMLYSSLQKLDTAINDLNDESLIDSFKAYKKAVFKYEAKLHRVITQDAPVSQTSEHTKNTLSTLNKKVIFSRLHSENAI